MNNARIAYWLRLVWAPLLIALEFTNLFIVFSEGGQTRLADPRSPYILQVATYGVCALIVMLDPSNATRLVQKRIFKWTFAALTLFTWGMLVRTFYVPAGIPSYDFIRTFGLQVHAIGFMLACVVIFDHPKVFALVKSGVALATLSGVALNLYELFHPGTFSSTSGRAAGLYIDSNVSGMALVLGSIVGLTAIRPRWREIFLLFAFAGVIPTFSREAILGFAIVVAGAALGRAVSVRRLLVGGVVVCALFSVLELGNSLRGSESFDAANLERLSLTIGDASAQDRLRLGRRVLEEFEAAPLFGHGFGTDEYWGDIQSHDFFLDMLANYGILGVFLIPTLVLSVSRKSWDSNVFGLVFLIWSFFLHLVLLLPFSLVLIAIEAVEPTESIRSLPPSNSRFRSDLQLRLNCAA
ncbi:MAG: O-antigen ligase family protein [Candidatus Binatus sp.]